MDLIWYGLFLLPNPTAHGLASNGYFGDWFIVRVGLIVITLSILVYYYFFTYPTKNALKRFWFSTLFIFISNIALSLVFLFLRYKNYLSDSGKFSEFGFGVSSAVAVMVNTALIFLLGFIILMVLSQFKIAWNLRAMRRYPFKWIP